MGAAGRLHARKSREAGAYLGATEEATEEASDVAAGRDAWSTEEAAVCRGALCRIVRRWEAKQFEIRPLCISYSSTPVLPDTLSDMLRQALRALRYLEHDGSAAKSSRRGKTPSADKCRSRLLRFVDKPLEIHVLELEKHILLRGAHLDRQRCAACSHVRNEVASVLSSTGRLTRLEEESGFKSAASATASSAAAQSQADTDGGHVGHTRARHEGVGHSSATAAAGGWVCLQGTRVLVNVYGKLDFTDILQPVEKSSASPHPRFASFRTPPHKPPPSPFLPWPPCSPPPSLPFSLKIDYMAGRLKHT